MPHGFPNFDTMLPSSTTFFQSYSGDRLETGTTKEKSTNSNFPHFFGISYDILEFQIFLPFFGFSYALGAEVPIID